jgi:hypothetical protein
MSSTTETGHAKNVAKLDELLSSVVGFGAAYNPSSPALELLELQTLSTSAKLALAAVNTASSAYSSAVAAREIAFEQFSKLTTRILNALKATGTSPQVVDNAQTIVRKLQGRRATPKKSEEQLKALATEGKVVKEISTSQLSYDSRIENLDKLIKLLASIPLYAPNEADLKVTAITALYNDLKAKNAAVLAATTQLSIARITRNEIMYKPNTGLVDVALAAKTYIKSVFGASSVQYKQISKLAFRAIAA